MSEKRILALLGFLLGLLGAVLVLIKALDFGRNPNINLDFVLAHIVAIVLAVAILLGSVLIYRAKYSTGGIVNLVLGIVVLLTPGIANDAAAILTIISGVLGIVSAETFR